MTEQFQNSFSELQQISQDHAAVVRESNHRLRTERYFDVSWRQDISRGYNTYPPDVLRRNSLDINKGQWQELTIPRLCALFSAHAADNRDATVVAHVLKKHCYAELDKQDMPDAQMTIANLIAGNLLQQETAASSPEDLIKVLSPAKFTEEHSEKLQMLISGFVTDALRRVILAEKVGAYPQLEVRGISMSALLRSISCYAEAGLVDDKLYKKVGTPTLLAASSQGLDMFFRKQTLTPKSSLKNKERSDEAIAMASDFIATTFNMIKMDKDRNRAKLKAVDAAIRSADNSVDLERITHHGNKIACETTQYDGRNMDVGQSLLWILHTTAIQQHARLRDDEYVAMLKQDIQRATIVSGILGSHFNLSCAVSDGVYNRFPRKKASWPAIYLELQNQLGAPV